MNIVAYLYPFPALFVQYLMQLDKYTRNYLAKSTMEGHRCMFPFHKRSMPFRKEHDQVSAYESCPPTGGVH